MRHGVRWLVFVGSFRLRHSFVIRHWAFVIDFCQSLASEHATAVGHPLGQRFPVDATTRICQRRSMLGETENQFSLTRAALSTGGRAKSKFLSVDEPTDIVVVARRRAPDMF